MQQALLRPSDAAFDTMRVGLKEGERGEGKQGKIAKLLAALLLLAVSQGECICSLSKRCCLLQYCLLSTVLLQILY